MMMSILKLFDLTRFRSIEKDQTWHLVPLFSPFCMGKGVKRLEECSMIQFSDYSTAVGEQSGHIQ